MAGHFVKVYGAMLMSSVWMESPTTRCVWVTLLLAADADGFFEASLPGLAHLARVSLPECEEALDILMRPDPYSKNPDNEGRRVEKVAGGWRILNSRAYRDLRTPKQVADAARKKRHRMKESVTRRDTSRDVTLQCDTSRSSRKSGVTSVTSRPEVEVEVEVEVEDLSTGGGDSARARGKPPPNGDPDVHATARRLTVAANRATADRFGEQTNPFLASSGPSHRLADAVLAAGVPVEFAERSVARQVSGLPEPVVSSMAYFRAGILRDWQQQGERDAAAAADPVVPLELPNGGRFRRPRSALEIVNEQIAREEQLAREKLS